MLDPFMGSGTTGCAAVVEGFEFVGIDVGADKIRVAEYRIQYWQRVLHAEWLARVGVFDFVENACSWSWGFVLSLAQPLNPSLG